MLTTEEVYVGMKIKCAVPARWLEVPSKSAYVWMKGRITEVNKHSVVMSVKSRKFRKRLDGLMYIANNGRYEFLKRQKL